jgi:hypothetical protein
VGEMTQALYAHMNNKTIKIKKKKKTSLSKGVLGISLVGSVSPGCSHYSLKMVLLKCQDLNTS